MNILNDKNCGWIKDLEKRRNIKILNKNPECDYLFGLIF